jgi:hypothetical protein
MSGCSEPPLHGYNLNVFIKATGGPQPPDIKFTDLKPVPLGFRQVQDVLLE